MNKGALSVVLAGGLLAGFALQAETRVWKGPSGGSWSEPTNWEGGVPANGDSVAFENADAIEVDNNIDDLTLGAILLRGAGQVTVGGKALSLQGDAAYSCSENTGWSIALSNGAPLVVNVPVTVTAKCLLAFYNDTTWNQDFTVADNVTMREYAPYRYPDSEKYLITFNGHFFATNATVDASVYDCNTVIFNKSAHFKKHYASSWFGICYYRFKAAGNTWAEPSVGGTSAQKFWDVEGAHDPTQPLYWSAVGDGNGRGRNTFYADQVVNGIESPRWSGDSKHDGDSIYSEKNITIFVRPDRNREAWAQFGLSAAAGKYTVDFEAQGEHADEVVQTMHDRNHYLAGKIIVRRGTFRTDLSSQFLSLPTIEMYGGRFESACTNEVPEFPALTSLRVENGRFVIDAESACCPFAENVTALSVYGDGKVEIPEGMTIAFKSVALNGVPLQPGTYRKGDESGFSGWIEGDGTVTVQSCPANAAYWKQPSSGSWNETAKWMPGVPKATDDAYVSIYGPGYTVTMAQPTDAPKSLTVENAKAGSRTTLAISGAVNLTDMPVTVDAGGRILVANGASLALTNTTSAAANGGALMVKNGGILAVNDAEVILSSSANGTSYKIGKDGRLVGTNATVYIRQDRETSGDSTLEPASDGGLIELAGDSLLDFTGGVNSYRSNVKYQGSLKLSGNAKTLTSYLSVFPSAQAGHTNVLSLCDHAQLTFTWDAICQFGDNWCNGGWLLVDLGSDREIKAPYGYNIGLVGNCVVNVHGGCQLKGDGNNLVVGGTGSANRPVGILNVFDGGSVYRDRTTQYGDCLYGMLVGENANKSTKVHGVGYFNVGPGGAVTNGTTSTGGLGNSGAYFRVGSGSSEGYVVQTGGIINHRDRYQVCVGNWGGHGEWIVSNGLTKVAADTYVGGIATNVMLGFIAGRNNSAAEKKYDFDDYTGVGLLRVAGGTYTSVSNLFFSMRGTGRLEMGPSADARLEAKDLTLASSTDGSATYRSSVLFTCGAEGTGCVALSGALTIAEGTKLTVDLSAYAGTKASLKLFTAAAVNGAFADGDIELIRNEQTRDAVVVQDGKCVRVRIPRGVLILVR